MTVFWLLINGILYLILGLQFIFRFDAISGALDISANSGSAAIELTAVYGGLETGFGILFIGSVFVSRYRLFSLHLLLFTYLCFAAGRLIGMVSHEITEAMTIYLLGFELLGFAVSGLILKQANRQSVPGK